jgi:hypothetical protein
MVLQDFERESAIWYSDADKTANLTTFNKSLINKMDKYCKEFPNTYKLIREIILDGEIAGKEYSFPKKLVSIRQPSSRKMTDEQKKAAGERLKKTKDKKK